MTGGAVEDRVEIKLTERAATFTPSEMRAVVLEQSVGELSPTDALSLSRSMTAERRILPLEGGVMTTLRVRAREQAIERRFAQLAIPADLDVGDTAREIAAEEVADRIGGQLSNEQTVALEVLTGPERGVVLIGPAGTGKGVVIDAAARAEQLTGRDTFGIAVSGSTAQLLGDATPALAGRTLTLDSLAAKSEHGSLQVGADTTIYFDEAGMGDTDRLERLTALVEHSGAKLIVIGDAAQLPSIGAGGMFQRLIHLAPSAELSDVRRTLDPKEKKAWAHLRAGRSDKAMAHYQSRGHLHMSDTRDQAVEQAVDHWAELTKTLPAEEVALISDASNKEIHRLNARAQHHRAERGELGELELPIPGVHYGIRQGDRVALIAQHHEPSLPRIENGTQGQVLDITPAGEAVIQFDTTGRQRTLSGDHLDKVRLGYARHIHRAQGATVTKTIVVTGGWQTSKESAYVEASRPREGTHWYVNRDDLGTEGQDHHRIQRLAANMQRSGAQTPSLVHPELPDIDWGPDMNLPIAPSRTRLLPGLARAIQRPARSEPEQAR